MDIHTTCILKPTCRKHSRGWETDSRQLRKPWTLSRVCITVGQFQYELMHIRGKDNAADVLSRLPVDQSQNEETSETEDFAYSVAIEAMRAALVPKPVEVASAGQTTLASAPSYYDRGTVAVCRGIRGTRRARASRASGGTSAV